MIRDNYLNIQNNLEVKENLQEMKEDLKDVNKGSRSKEALISLIKGDYSLITDLLKNEDPKIRKNAAIILGLLGDSANVDALYDAYVNDETMYNKAAYVDALRKLDFKKYNDALKTRFEELKKGPIPADSKKHVIEEINQLKKIFGNGKKEFTGYNLENEIILTTHRNFKEITEDALGDIPHKIFTAGIHLKVKDLRKILPIRTYEELLFVPGKVKTVKADPEEAAKELFEGGIRDYIFSRIGILNENGRVTDGMKVNFRTELKVKDKTLYPDFSKKFSAELESLTKWELTNSVDEYDTEIRFIPNSEGRFNVLVKFCILKDIRFS